MKTFFKFLLSISLSILSQSCETGTECVTPAGAASAQSVQISHGTFASEQGAPSTTLYGTKSVAIAFVLTNIN